ncbi:MAG: hypothetical protein FWD61_04390 [Phycisphaerales bacterium]|nr:hypothetical protein [Phycisphaerales bacterium]
MDTDTGAVVDVEAGRTVLADDCEDVVDIACTIEFVRGLQIKVENASGTEVNIRLLIIVPTRV